MAAVVVPLVYLTSAILVILGLKQMARVRSARRGNVLAAIGMGLAILGTAIDLGSIDYGPIAVSAVVGGALGVAGARRVSLMGVTRVATLLGGAAGVAAGLVGISLIDVWGGNLATVMDEVGPARGGALTLGIVLAAVAAGGSLPGITERGRPSPVRPAVVSLVNGVAGLAAALVGFALSNHVLIMVGGVVGVSALVVARIIAGAANRPLGDVLFGSAGGAVAAATGEYTDVRSCGAEEAAMVLENARSVVFVPGYGMAVAQAQNAVHDLAKILEKRGARVIYAIHPVAGIIPGHMNILLDEADVPAESLAELDEANAALMDADAAVVLGANDIVNPAAESAPASPVYGMPIIDVRRARSVFVIKRSLRPGFAGVKNELFEAPNTMMIYGDVKKVAQALTTELKGAGGH